MLMGTREDAAQVAGRVRVVIAEVDFQAGIAQAFLHPVEAFRLAGVHNNQTADRAQIKLLQLLEVVEMAEVSREILGQPPLSGPGKDQGCAGIELPRRDH